MASILKVDTIQDQDGNNIINESANTITIGASGDTITIPSGATLANSGIVTGFESTGIDDNATSTAITIDSSENIGINTASPAFTLDTSSTDDTIARFMSSGSTGAIQVGNDTASVGTLSRIDFLHNNNQGARIESVSTEDFVSAAARTDNLLFKVSTNGSVNEVMRLKGDKIGVGTSNPTMGQINLETTGNFTTAFTDPTATCISMYSSGTAGDGNYGAAIAWGALGGVNTHQAAISSVQTGSDANQVGLAFFTHSSTTGSDPMIERMRLTSDDRLLIGSTTVGSGDRIEMRAGTHSITVRSDSLPLSVDRRIEGDVIQILGNGTVKGRIGYQSTDRLYIGGGAGLDGIGIDADLFPTTYTGGSNDNNMDLGKASARWDDVRATNGTIQTSDQNEKQSIQSLTTAEMNVAKRLSPLIKTFKWNSSVEEKGDSARTHTGIIAQDVQQSFTDEGLDASNYALFCSDTWWEKEISVDAVAEEVDENGNVITESKDAYTYMDTKEEATDGYTERTRLGIRYPELLSFIQAYNDQRFTELEARITTLENA